MAEKKDGREDDADVSPSEHEARRTDDGGTAKEDGPGKKRRRIITIVIVALVAVVAIAAGIAWYLHSRQFETTDDAFIDGQIVRIAAQEQGRLIKVPVDPNSIVVRGDILARIDASMLSAELKLRQAQLLEARTSVAEAQAAIVEAGTNVDAARSQAEGAKVTAVNEQARAERFGTISEQTGELSVSQQELDDTVAGAAEAKAAADTAETQIATAESQVTAAEAQMEAAKAGVQAADANVATTQVNVDRLTIAAPIDGQVVQRNVGVGSYVAPGTQLMALVPNDLYVTANFKETQLARIRPGQTVDIAVDAFPDVDFKGTVVSIQSGAGQAFQLLPAQNATGNFVKVVQRVPVRISIDSPDIGKYPIGPGMSVVPSIRVED